MKLKKLTTALMLTGLASLPLASFADSTEDLVNALVTKGVLTEEEGALLAKNRTKEKSSEAKVKMSKKGIQISSADDAFSMQIGGRLHATLTEHSHGSLGSSTDDPVDGTEIRRARLYAKGKLYKKFGYMAEVDWGGDSVGIKDFFGTYSPNKNWEFTFGNQKHAFSQEVQESSNDIMFAERSLVYGMSVPFFDRAIGVNLKAMGETWNVQGGLYGDGVKASTDAANSSSASASQEKNEGKGFAIRGTWNPILEKDRMVMLGANYGYRKQSDTGEINNKKDPQFVYKTTNFSDLAVVDSGKITGFNDVQMAILEFSAMNGPFSFQSEYAKGRVNRDDGYSDYDVSAYYAQVGWVLTGESRTFKATDGEFKRLKPSKNFDPDKGTWGAWEVALRHDGIDLTDADVAGGDAKRMTLNLNWYLNENMRLLAGYERFYDLDLIQRDNGRNVDDIDVFQVRAQWAI
jgi:phosphate-selective porin OprO/OprP